MLDGLRKIARRKAPFISRGDKSGTHAAELRYWKDAGVDLAAAKGDWYKEIGQGMGPALNTASAQNAYVLADRGTWLSFKNRGDLAILVEGRPALFNQYGVMLVNPAKHAHVKAAERPGLHRLARVARRAEDHRGIQDRRASSSSSRMHPEQEGPDGRDR